MSEQSTIDYYNRCAQDYYERTVHADVSGNIARFTELVTDGGSIVDIGCGSGRDIRYFLEQGFRAEGIDASAKMCRLAREYTGAEIECTTLQDWAPAHRYDGIWANASLLHLTMEEIQTFVTRLPELLEADGVAYMSFKSGVETGVDMEGRYYTDISQKDLFAMIDSVPGLELLAYWISWDALGRDEFRWLNVIVRIS